MIDLDDLSSRLKCKYGLAPRYTWASDAPRALEDMSRRHGDPVSKLYRRLWRDKDLLDEFVAYLTVQESFFLRHPEHFDFLVRAVAGRLTKDHGVDHIVIWSAGCANGEEPYSAAIMLHSELGARAMERIRIHASDINGAAIERARAGRYGGWSFRGTPSWFVARYFDRADGSKCLLVENIRRAVTFERSSLEDSLRALRDASVDYLFFRNVAIYLAGDALVRIFSEMHRVLKPGGTMFLAPTDPRPPAAGFGSCAAEIVGVFRRLEPGEAVDVGPEAGPEPPADNRRSAGGADAPAHRVSRPTVPRRIPREVEPSPTTAPADLLAVSADKRDAADWGEMADRGGALRVATRLIRAEPTSKEGYLLRAWIHFSSRTFEEAVADLRRVVFLDRDDKIARFWFAIALRCANLSERSSCEATELLRQLEILPEDMVLEDGSTTVSELRTAVARMTG